ncbi:hypothetical protein MCEMSEM23_02740 [Rhabdaerophilaceae bacterium]
MRAVEDLIELASLAMFFAMVILGYGMAGSLPLV